MWKDKLAGKTVLIIEDLDLVLLVLEGAVSLAGARVETATGGLHGLALARELEPDLILCDYSMPGMDGLEVLREIRQDPEIGSTPFILTSVYSDPDLLRRAEELGASAFMPKETYPEEMIRMLQDHLRDRG